MRFDLEFKFWTVIDPTPQSVLGDILYNASLRDLELQFKGGLTAAEHPTLFTDRDEAEREALARLAAVRTAETILRLHGSNLDGRIARIVMLGENGAELATVEVKAVPDASR